MGKAVASKSVCLICSAGSGGECSAPTCAGSWERSPTSIPSSESWGKAEMSQARGLTPRLPSRQDNEKKKITRRLPRPQVPHASMLGTAGVPGLILWVHLLPQGPVAPAPAVLLTLYFSGCDSYKTQWFLYLASSHFPINNWKLAYMQNDVCTRLFTKALFVLAKHGRELKHSSRES